MYLETNLEFLQQVNKRASRLLADVLIRTLKKKRKKGTKPLYVPVIFQ